MSIKSFVLRFILLIVGFNLGCSKFSTTEIGANIVPNFGDSLLIKDTFIEVVTSTSLAYETDTSKYGYYLNSNKTNILYATLGTFSDENFGTKKATLSFSIVPKTTGTPFTGTGIVLDSTVLQLAVKTYFGDTLTAMKINVHQLTDSIRSSYYGYYPFSTTIPYNTTPISSHQFNIKDLNAAVKIQPLRLSLPSSFGAQFLQAATTVWDSAQAFRSFFRGFAIVPDQANTTNAFVHINTVDTGTALVLYYTSTESGATSATQKRVVLSLYDYSYTGTMNTLTWDKSNARISNYLTNTSTNSDEIFLQTNPRTKVNVSIPTLNNLPTDWIIYKAELIAKQIPQILQANSTKIPPRYALAYIDSSGSYLPIPKDYTVGYQYENQISYLGGYRIDTVDVNKQAISTYRFNITRYVQNVLLKKINNQTITLSAFNYVPFYDNTVVYNQIGGGFVRLGGGANSNADTKMLLRIVYRKP